MAAPPGPMRGVRFIHVALSRELDLLEDDARGLVAGTTSVDDVKARMEWLGYTLGHHAEAESVTYFAPLNERVPHSTDGFEDDHHQEEALRADMDRLIAAHEAGDGTAAAGFLRRVTELNDLITHHMRKEEEVLLPVFESNFELPEQGAIVGAMIAHLPADFMARGLPWIYERIDPEDRVAYTAMLKGAMPPEPFAGIMGLVENHIGADAFAPSKAVMNA